MKTAMLVLNFGEPEEPSLERVVPFLERIFAQNSSLESAGSPEEVRERSRRLAEERGPGLVEEYEEIGGSPLNAQARDQARLLETELRRRGHDVETFPVFQFTEPFPDEGIRAARDAGAELVVALPVYPLCGRSTTIAALDTVREALDGEEWDVPLREVTGWHRHPDYVPLHADNIRRYVNEHDLDLYDARTALLFSVHGTPKKYVEEGPRYVKYAGELASRVARELGKADYEIGYQNHRNRPIEWTEPDVDEVVAGLDADRVVVMAASFMHEQSETLAELDDELREVAEERGIAFHRVPIPHGSGRFIRVLADLTEPLLTKVPAFDDLQLKRCLCRKTPYTFCLNAGS
ncbi:MAG TPA: ferrochelatase [Longimicrobiales bacterium]|nr:ferrochelatase [Longimicrobiales bacterium]